MAAPYLQHHGEFRNALGVLHCLQWVCRFKVQVSFSPFKVVAGSKIFYLTFSLHSQDFFFFLLILEALENRGKWPRHSKVKLKSDSANSQCHWGE